MDSHDDLTIPRWFLRLASCVLALAVPWAGWVTLQLAAIEVKVEHASGQQALLQAHLADAPAHAARETQLRLEAVERRLEAMAAGQ